PCNFRGLTKLQYYRIVLAVPVIISGRAFHGQYKKWCEISRPNSCPHCLWQVSWFESRSSCRLSFSRKMRKQPKKQLWTPGYRVWNLKPTQIEKWLPRCLRGPSTRREGSRCRLLRQKSLLNLSVYLRLHWRRSDLCQLHQPQIRDCITNDLCQS